jgi:hypothetical protein
MSCVFYVRAAANVTMSSFKPYVDAAKAGNLSLRILLVPKMTVYDQLPDIKGENCLELDKRYQQNLNDNPNIQQLDLTKTGNNPVSLQDFINRLNKFLLGGLQLMYIRMSPESVMSLQS